MKKPILTLLTTMILTSLTFAQIPKGSLGIGGSISSDYSFLFSSEEDKSNGYTLLFEPSIGFFPAKNFEIGIAPKIGVQNYTTTSQYGSSSTTYDQKNLFAGASAYLNLYFGKSFFKPNIGLGLGVDYGNGEVSSSSLYTSSSDFSTFSVGGNFHFGFCFFVNDAVAIRLNVINYQFSHEKQKSSYTSNSSSSSYSPDDYTIVYNTHSITESIGVIVILPSKNN